VAIELLKEEDLDDR